MAGGIGNGDVTIARMKRLRAVETMMLNHNTPKEIAIVLAPEYGVKEGTIQNDCTDIKRLWGQHYKEKCPLEGGPRYLSALKQVRRLAMKDKLLETVHKMDKEIARVQGVHLKSDEHTIRHIDVEAAREFMDRVMTVVFEEVTDAETQQKIVSRIEALASADP